MEIAFAKFDGNVFTQQQYITENAYYDGSAVLAPNTDGTVSVVWVQNESSDILTPGTTSKIMHSVVGNNGVISTETLVTSTNYILNMSAEYINGTLNVAYSADKDGDLNTANDVEIYLYKNGAVSNLTDDEITNSNPQIVDATLYWFENAKIMGYDLNTATVREIGEGTENYHIVKREMFRKSYLYELLRKARMIFIHIRLCLS